MYDDDLEKVKDKMDLVDAKKIFADIDTMTPEEFASHLVTQSDDVRKLVEKMIHKL